jgi:uncharacterized protein YdaU (DUF1376 family)
MATYRADTFMLTWEQDLAYRRMLDLAYETEKPLPKDRSELYALLRASTAAQKAAVEYVLKKYWRNAGRRASGFINQKASKELARFKQTQAKRVNAANQRWLPFSKSNAHALQVDTSLSLSSHLHTHKRREEKNPSPPMGFVTGPDGSKGEYLSEKERQNKAAVERVLRKTRDAADDKAGE